MRKVGVAGLVALIAACGSSGGGGTAGDAGTNPGQDATSDAASLADAAPTDGGAHADSGAPDDASRSGDAVSASDGGGGDASTLHASPLGGSPVLGSSGCGATLSAGAPGLSLPVDGATRTGLFVVPAGYDPALAYPLVFVFHGDGGTGAQIRTSLDLEPAAAGKAIFVYLDGANQTWDYALTGTNADMDFVFAARDYVRGKACVDLGRTFATGMSRGGFFVDQLACRYGNAEFAAMAPHSGTLEQDDGNAYVYGPYKASGGPYIPGEYDFMCPVDGTPSNNPPLPALPPPMFIVHGQCDTESGVEFSEGVITAEHWGFAARCSTTPDVITVPDTGACGAVSSCPTFTGDPCYVAPGCAAGHDVTFCAIPEMGHSVWCNAAARIWAFFAAH